MCNYSQKEMSVIVDNCRQINAANPCHDNKCNHNFFNERLLISTIQYTILTNRERRYKTKIKGTDKIQLSYRMLQLLESFRSEFTANL